MSKISENIYFELKEFLEGYSKLLILGIGNDIRGDDGLGPYIIEGLFNLKEDVLNNESFSQTNLSMVSENEDIVNFNDIFNNVSFINGGSVPENFTGPIKKFNPSHMIIIDASLMNMNPGEINIVSKESIINLSVSTHSMSLAYLIKYLESDFNSNINVLFIGIQPESMDLSMDLSDSVKETCDELIKVIFSLI